MTRSHSRYPRSRIASRLIAAWFVLAMGTSLPAQRSPQPPNILFIMVDDLGPEWVSAYGAEEIETPNIDALAAGGMLFENVYSMPQCTPTRVTLLTGQYPWRHGWINHWDVPRWGRGCHFDPNHYTTFARILREAGYATAIAGKWQINDFRVQPEVLVEHGFDEYCMWTGYESGNPASAERYWDPYLHTKEGSRTYEGQFSEDVFTDFLIDFMRRNRERPMMMYYPMCLTHGPMTTTPLEPNAEGRMARHKAMVRYTDHLLGKLTGALDELGLRENTIIFWTTDNGSVGGITGTMNGRRVRGGKGRLSEAGVRQPFIVNAPGLVPAGTRTEALTDFTDLLPTLADLAGAPLPEGLAVDGRSFADVILGKSDDGPRDWILAMGSSPATIEKGRVVPVYEFRDRAIRDPRFKMIIGTNRRPRSLYDLIADPAESVDLIDSTEPDAVAARKKFESVLESLPRMDGKPLYDPLAPQAWDITDEELASKIGGSLARRRAD
ncbi:MAG: sulfatase-like hydrolase/transferase [Gammaproteobacteria bacterium]|nr:sulfatase-like hydrolase/transferase [Gammaproteobacteria bacterium]